MVEVIEKAEAGLAEIDRHLGPRPAKFHPGAANCMAAKSDSPQTQIALLIIKKVYPELSESIGKRPPRGDLYTPGEFKPVFDLWNEILEIMETREFWLRDKVAKLLEMTKANEAANLATRAQLNKDAEEFKKTIVTFNERAKQNNQEYTRWADRKKEEEREIAAEKTRLASDPYLAKAKAEVAEFQGLLTLADEELKERDKILRLREKKIADLERALALGRSAPKDNSTVVQKLDAALERLEDAFPNPKPLVRAALDFMYGAKHDLLPHE